jgi:hypothetical protein
VVVLHTFLALAGGFIVTTALAAVVSALLVRFTPGWVAGQSQPALGYVVVTLGATFLSAAAGGYVTACIAAANPLIHVLVLGIVVLALAALSALQEKGKLPVAYQLALVALSPVGVLAGGLLRLRVLGIL